MHYRIPWDLIPDRVQVAIQELQELVEDLTDWHSAQITVGESITVDVYHEEVEEGEPSDG